jgi:hypothetical protein
VEPLRRQLRQLLDLSSRWLPDDQKLIPKLDLDEVHPVLITELPLQPPKLWFCQYLDLPKPAWRHVDDSQREADPHPGLAQHKAMPGCDQGLSESLLLIPPCTGDKSASGFRIL